MYVADLQEKPKVKLVYEAKQILQIGFLPLQTWFLQILKHQNVCLPILHSLGEIWSKSYGNFHAKIQLVIFNVVKKHYIKNPTFIAIYCLRAQWQNALLRFANSYIKLQYTQNRVDRQHQQR